MKLAGRDVSMNNAVLVMTKQFPNKHEMIMIYFELSFTQRCALPSGLVLICDSQRLVVEAENI